MTHAAELVEGLRASKGLARIDSKRSPAYPKELTYPCCRQALGGWVRYRHARDQRRVYGMSRAMSLEAAAGQHRRIG